MVEENHQLLAVKGERHLICGMRRTRATAVRGEPVTTAPQIICNTMQEHQRNLTNATISSNSDMISISFIMVVYEINFFSIFQANLRNQ